ncbi:TnsD family Tn7-like transposition protein [Paraburkholderia bryophila]|uniref:TnsD family Tn7-like transposition protein n=1 Tax=Paraburkholderia bryophila TaxID=420952 RepID=UPI00359C3F82
MDSIAAHCDGYSPRCSCTMRTARSRTSAENLFDLFMAPFSQELEPPPNPGRFTAIYWAKLDGVFYRRRPRAIHPQNMGSLIAGLLAGAGPDELAQTVGVPRRSVTNFIKAHPDIAAAWRTKFALRQRDYYRARMLRLIADHPHATRSELRRMRGSGYMWLYRHDRDWLGENLPSLWLTRAP